MAWLGNWANRRKITISNTNIDADLSNFPILVHLSASSGTSDTDITDIFTELGSDSGRKKIAITTSDGATECFVEIERFDYSNLSAWLWIKVPFIDASAGTELYIYYDIAQADNTFYIGDTGDAPAYNVWDSNFKGVWHMAQDPDGDPANAIKDSTNNNNHGSPHGSMVTSDLVDGKTGKALDFDEVDDYLDCADSSSLNFGVSDLSISLIIKSADSNIGYFLRKTGAAETGAWYGFRINTGKVNLYIKDITPNTANVAGNTIINDGSWHSIDGTIDRGSSDGMALYFDGIEESSYSSKEDPTGVGTLDNIHNLYIGRRGNQAQDYYEGIIDELRISNIARTAAWIKATHYSNWDGLAAYGDVETEIPDGIDATLPMIVCEIIEGELISATLPAITANLEGGGGGFLEATLPAITADIIGSIKVDTFLEVTLPAITAEIQGGLGGFLEATLPAITADIKGGAILEATLPAITARLEGDVEIAGDLIVSLPAITASLEGKVNVHGDLVCVLPALTAELIGTMEVGGDLACTLPMITAELNGYQDITGELVATLPAITAYLIGSTDRFADCDVLRYAEPTL